MFASQRSGSLNAAEISADSFGQWAAKQLNQSRPCLCGLAPIRRSLHSHPSSSQLITNQHSPSSLIVSHLLLIASMQNVRPEAVHDT